MAYLVALIALFTWIGGFVLANGFWSTLLCIIPFWSWYVFLEHLFRVVGML
jgi:hypothetical protein